MLLIILQSKAKPIHLASASLSDFSEVPTYQGFLKELFKLLIISLLEKIFFILKRIFECKI